MHASLSTFISRRALRCLDSRHIILERDLWCFAVCHVQSIATLDYIAQLCILVLRGTHIMGIRPTVYFLHATFDIDIGHCMCISLGLAQNPKLT